MKALVTIVFIILLAVVMLGYSQANSEADKTVQVVQNKASQPTVDLKQSDHVAEEISHRSSGQIVDTKPFFTLGSIAAPPEPDSTEKAKPVKAQ